MGVHGRKRAVPVIIDGGQTSEYEQTREKRIKENQERMEKLGVLDISLKLKSFNNKTTSTPTVRKTPQPIQQPSRRSSRKLGVEKTAAETKKDKKAAKDPNKPDPNKPKRPASAFFVFMEEFRETYKEKHPNNKSVAAVGKAGGDKWKSLTEAEKKPYQEKADKRKEEYDKNKEAYNRRQAGEADEEESDKSKSEVDEEDGSGEEDEDDD